MNRYCRHWGEIRQTRIGGQDRGVAILPDCVASAVVSARGYESPTRMHLRLIRVVVVIGVVLSETSALQAEHAEIDLRVSRPGREEATATADREPPAGGVKDPPMLKVNLNEPLTFQFILTNTYPHKVIPHVRVRYYVARVGKLGRKPSSFAEWTGPDDGSPPRLEPGVVTEGQFTMDFKPNCRVGTRLKFKISEPGIYSGGSKLSTRKAITSIFPPST